MTKQLVFLCGARDFHAMDWYKSAKQLLVEYDVIVLTDLIGGEGFKTIIDKTDKVVKLFILDHLLFRKQSHVGNLWRNTLKVLIFPLQVLLLSKYSKRNPGAVYHAHSMYYLWLGWAAGIEYVGTPQGSDVLIKPFRSKLFRYFAVKSLKAAKAITVDSVIMKQKVFELSGVDAYIIQNGIDLDDIQHYAQNDGENILRNRILSIRGFTPLYRIKEIAKARNSSLTLTQRGITYLYPFYEDSYKKEVLQLFNTNDQDLGRVTRERMYEFLVGSQLVLSIPYSDSSPRSVYEAIFCGCAVAISYHPYYDTLPDCMKARTIIVDIDKTNWFEEAVEQAKRISQSCYSPSEEAIEMFDQKGSFKKVLQLLFK